MSRLWRAAAVGVVLAALSPSVAAKGDGRSFEMVGQVAKVKSRAGRVACLVTGDLLAIECRNGQCATTPWAQARVVSLRIRQRESFFAMTPDWRGGSIQSARKLTETLMRAATPGRWTKFELLEPRLSFGRSGEVLAVDAEVVRVTDHDLK